MLRDYQAAIGRTCSACGETGLPARYDFCGACGAPLTALGEGVP